MHIDFLRQPDRELDLENDPLDELDNPDLDYLAAKADRMGIDLLDLLEQIEAAEIAVVRAPDLNDRFERERVTAVRKCLDCNEPARPRKSANGPWPKRCQEHTKTRKRFMDAGGSKARAPYRPCCVGWQLDPDPGHRGLCLQCRDARKESRKPVSDRETAWLANTLGPSGWNVQKAGWLRE